MTARAAAQKFKTVMNFELTDQQTLLQQTIRDFAQAEIAPGASERDETARFPRELIPKMADRASDGQSQVIS